MSCRILQLTDTHVVARGEHYCGSDTAAYVRDAIASAAALEPAPVFAIVTGDLANSGTPQEYEQFTAAMAELRLPYVVVPGNHDDAAQLRRIVPSPAFGDSREPRMRFVSDAFEVRVIGLDVTRPRSPGAELDGAALAWLRGRLAEEPTRPTIVAIHQPPFRSGLHYLDVFGFRGAARLRRVLDDAPHVGRVLCGHIHTVKTRSWRHAMAISAPSTAPQFVPELFERHILGIRRESPGFAIHDWSRETGFVTTIYRRHSTANTAERYVAEQRFA
ncbi:MAG: metallophosphoesterase [Candidatus Eremiobacteraeota bacterium]|nr:metallophosphoesterase [Candidatus Eremiobacteraeota bacterium]